MAVVTSVTIGGERPCDDDFERRVIRGSNSNYNGTQKNETYNR
jgi:hypothetical protein